MSTLMDKPRGVYLTGSVSLPDAESVFRNVATIMPGRVRRIPDGETGPRRYYLFTLAAFMKEAEGLVVEPYVGSKANSELPTLALTPGFSAVDVEFKNLGIADAAIASFKVFEKLQNEGVIPEDTKFLMGVISPMEILSTLLGFDFEGFEPAVETAVKREIARATTAIPHSKLAIQIDVVAGVYAFGTNDDGAQKVAGGMVRSPFSGKNQKEEVLIRIARYSSWVPKDVELGYHFCFGDVVEPDVLKTGRIELGLENSGSASIGSLESSSNKTDVQKPGIEAIKDGQPKTASSMVEMANELARRLARPYQFVHMPFPMHRETKEFVEPFRNLKLPSGAELYLGLVNWRDGTQGAARRIALAQGVAPPFGIGTACGMGRIGGGAERQLGLFRTLAQLSDHF